MRIGKSSLSLIFITTVLLFCLVMEDRELQAGLMPGRMTETVDLAQTRIRKERELIIKPVKKETVRYDPAGPSVRNKIFNIGANPVKGETRARITLIEFADYQDGYSARHVRETYPQIEERFIETGKIRYVLLDLPLERIHKLAFKAAEAAHCAGEQGRYWEMRDRLFRNQRRLEPWSAHATELGLDVARFDRCMARGKYAGSVREDMSEARKAGLTGTPGFVLGLTDPDNPVRVKALSLVRGAQTFASFEAEIEAALAEALKKR